MRDHPSFVSVPDEPGLPRVLLIGDSISMQYTLPVREELRDLANVHRPARNCRSTRQTLTELDEYLGDGAWDVIHFNWGIHDITHLNADGKASAPPEGKLQVPLDEYERNVAALVKRLEQTGATLIWASTTPIGTQSESQGYRRDRDVVDYNAAAARVMMDENIVINDLYSHVKPHAEEWLRDGVHFNDEGTLALTDQVSAAIRQAIRNPRQER